ncbi:MAG: trypsin-like peptidase domain-containing protein [Planctomycetes bacterium]|nr:trypsin-like peptidase domain-containing protein [Planctomycetota bacterium]
MNERWCILAISAFFMIPVVGASRAEQPKDQASNRSAETALRRTPVVEAYERARDSVVNISATEKIEVPRWGVNIFGDVFAVPSQRDARSVGSGFIIHEKGYIATNAHVISAGSQLAVTLADGTEYEARIIGRDTNRDLAVIKIEPTHPLTPIRLGHSDDLMIGEQTIAVGNPVGLHNSVTVGVVSALHRELEVQGRVVYRDVIQTDASINPGNSGGPLLNILGELIGVNTAIRGDAQNIGFAIPVDQLREILPSVLDYEKLNKVVVGVRLNQSDPPKIAEVREGSPAARAGIKSGDTLAAVDGHDVSRALDYYVAMLEHKAGDEVAVELAGSKRGPTVKLAIESAPKPDGKKLAQEKLGLTLADVKEDVAKRFQLRRPGGVIVIGVEPRSPVDRNVHPGDLLVSIGSSWLTDMDMVGSILSEAKTGDPIDLGFRRIQRGTLYDLEVEAYAR